MEKLPDLMHHSDSGETNINSHEYKLLLYGKVNEIVDYLNAKESAREASMNAAKKATAEAVMDAREKAAEEAAEETKE